MSRDPVEVLTEVFEYHKGTPLGADLFYIREHYGSLRTVAALAVSAAVKHTGGRHAAKGSRDQASSLLKLDRDAVGRMHNAARVARAALDIGACAMCKDRADSGVDLVGQPGSCAECGRIYAAMESRGDSMAARTPAKNPAASNSPTRSGS